MKKKILIRITELENITIELDDTSSPKTCTSFLKSLEELVIFFLGIIHVRTNCNYILLVLLIK